jgi:hypothetical protein
MRSVLRWSFGLLFVCGMIGMIIPDLLTFDVLNGTIHQELAEQEQIHLELEEANNVIEERIHVKDQLIQDLIDGRRSYEVVIMNFAEMNLSHESIMASLENRYPNCSHDELMARNVYDFVLSSNPPESVILGLQKEFSQLFPKSLPLSSSH